MRRCIIHIGHAKTATTYLQHCLHLNAELFAQAGTWLPSDFTEFGFYDLATLSRTGAVISGNIAPLHVLMTDGPGALMPRMEQFLFTAPPSLPSDCDVLLSSELFFYYKWAMVRLVRAARRSGLAPELIAFLPRQDRAAIAGYLQNVRYHGFSQGVVDFLVHDRNMPYCHYLDALRGFAEIEPDVPITLRSFHPDLLVGGDVFTDFLAAIGSTVDPGACARPLRVSNQGLLLEHYELLRVATILGHADAAARLRAAELALSPDDRQRIARYYYRPGLHAFLVRNYLHGNTELLERFMPNASAAEQDYWRTLDEPGPPVALEAGLLEHLRLHAFD